MGKLFLEQWKAEMMQEIGTVISTMEGPSPSQLDFVVSKGVVHRGQFVEIPYSEGTMVCLVTDVIKTNRYFERAESVKEFESNGFALYDQFPVGEWEYLIAKTRPLGVMAGGQTKRPTYPPGPGTKVLDASASTLKQFLSFEEESGLHLGKLEYHDLEVKLGLGKLFQKHLAIMAQSGYGKCVGPNSEILLGDGRIAKIRDLVDECVSEDSIQRDGIEFALNYGSDFAISAGLGMKTNSCLIEGLSRRKAPAEMVRIRTRMEKELELTPEHLVPVLRESFEWVPASEISESDFVLLSLPKIKGGRQAIDFIEVWKDSDSVRVDSVSKELEEKIASYGIKEFCQKAGMKERTLKDWLNSSGIPLRRLREFCSIFGMDFDSLKQRIPFLRRKSKRIPSRIEVNDDFARMLAYLLAEGRNTGKQIMFSNASPEIRQEFKMLSERVFSEKAAEIKRKDSLCIYNLLLAESLQKIGFTNSSWTKFVPEELMKSGLPAIKSFLGAFIDCNGRIAKRVPSIEICLASPHLIRSIEAMLLRHGIVSRIAPKRAMGKTYPRLIASGPLNFNRLSGIRFLIPHKEERFKHYCSLKANTNIETIPNTKPHLDFIFSKLRLPKARAGKGGLSNYFSRNDNPSRESLRKIVAFLESECVGLKRSCESALAELEGMLAENQSSGNSSQLISGNSSAAAGRLYEVSRELRISTRRICPESGKYEEALYNYAAGFRNPPSEAVCLIRLALIREIREMVSFFPEIERRISFLKSLADSDFFFDKVKSKEFFKPDYEFVYDLQTSLRNFTANGIIVHNSYLVSVLLEELLERKKEDGRIATIVLDVHGEYSNFAFPPKKGKTGKDYSDRTRLVKGNEIRIGISKASAGMIAGIVPGFSPIQKRALQKILSELKEGMHSGSGPFGLNELLQAIRSDESIKDNTRQALENSIHSLFELGIFAETDSPSFSDLVKPGMLTIIDLSEVIEMRKKQAIVSYLSRKLFTERRRQAICPFLLVLEEAHQFVPEHTAGENAICRGMIETIAREGRKFGASLCLVSQRPIRLSTTVLSQCGTHVLLRISNPYDLKHIQESSEGLDQESTKILTGMRVGEALIVGEATHYPVFFHVRQRKSAESSHEKTLEKASQEFEENSAEFQKEVDEFM
ncbi:MAG: DUF87 domain-containing protein [archaeon]